MRLSVISSLLIASFITSACDSNSDSLTEVPIYQITGVSIQAVEREAIGETINFFFSDTLTTRLYFDVRTEAEVVDIKYEDIPPCDDVGDCILNAEVQNPTLYEHRFMTFNRPISYRGRIFEAGENLLEDEALVQAFDGSFLDLFFPFQLTPFAGQFVNLQKEAFEITEGDYEIAFGWGTVSGEVFTDTVRVYIALE